MNTSTALAIVLVANGLIAFGYRIFRWKAKSGPLEDAIGGGILAVLLGLLSLGVADLGWARWLAFGYGIFFAVIVVPIWTLAVLIPGRPGRIDYAFAGLYEVSLGAIAVLALLA